jgi:hypothetical protein
MAEELQKQMNDIVEAVDKVVVEGTKSDSAAASTANASVDDIPSDAASSSQLLVGPTFFQAWLYFLTLL